MKAVRKPPKPYWELNKSELAEATREFDCELVGGFHPLGADKAALWNRIREETTTEDSCDGVAPVRLRSAADVEALRERIKKAAAALAHRLKKLAVHGPFELLKDFKLQRLGFDPYDPSMEMNLVEQINQSATLLVACSAVECLLRKHPSDEGYIVSRPTSKGYDVWASDVSVVAEVFAATFPGSNQKIKKDLNAILGKPKAPFRSAPEHRYVFFVCRSLDGFPPKSHPLSLGTDPEFGDVWRLLEDGHCSVTVVRLKEESVFRQ